MSIFFNENALWVKLNLCYEEMAFINCLPVQRTDISAINPGHSVVATLIPAPGLVMGVSATLSGLVNHPGPYGFNQGGSEYSTKSMLENHGLTQRLRLQRTSAVEGGLYSAPHV